MSIEFDHTAETIEQGSGITLEAGGANEITQANAKTGYTHSADTNYWPRAALVFAYDFIGEGSLSEQISSALPVDHGFNFYCYDTTNLGADGDSFDVPIFLKAGTYTFGVYGQKGANCGILDWTLDGVSIETGQDWYANPAVPDTLMTTANVTVTGDGYHKLTGTINGKNVASTDYYWTLTCVFFIPASYPARA